MDICTSTKINLKRANIYLTHHNILTLRLNIYSTTPTYTKNELNIYCNVLKRMLEYTRIFLKYTNTYTPIT